MLSLKKSATNTPIAISMKDAKQVFLDDQDMKLAKNNVDKEDLAILPRTDGQREVLYIAAPSGTGKSYMAKRYIEYYNKLYKKRPVYIFSVVVGDKTFKSLKSKNIFFIPIDDSLVTEPINPMTEFEDCLVVFDDYEQISNKHISKEIDKIIVALLETGRHKRVSVLLTSHLILSNDKKRLRTILNETHKIAICPRSITNHTLTYFVKGHLGLTDKDLIKRIYELKTRFIVIQKSFPMFIMHDQGVWMV